MAQLRDLPLELLFLEGPTDELEGPAKLIEQAMLSVDDRDRAVLALAEVLSGTSLSTAMPLLDLRYPEGFAGSLRLLVGRSLIQVRGSVVDVPALVGDALAVIDPASQQQSAQTVTSAIVEAFGRAERKGADLADVAALAAQVATNLTAARRWTFVVELTHGRIVDLLNRRGYWAEYAVLLRAGIRAGAELGDRHAQVELGCRLTRKLPQMGDLLGAHAALSDVERVVADGDTDEHAELYSHRALLYDLEGDDDAALGDLARSRAIWYARGDGEKSLIVEKLIGNILMRRKEYPKARAAFEAALAIHGVEPDGKDRLEAMVGLARCDLAEDRPEHAEARLLKVIERMRAVRYDAGLPKALLTLALSLERMARDDEASEAARQAATATGTDPDVIRAAHMLEWRLKGAEPEFERRIADESGS
jgi:tetratricopeptide (TPR) repeat protein